ncbi:MAG: hypothetical protein QF614_03135 [SAR324 cluster bacterium]|nr:hypothetical protein [SAR324 cluster bacterium]
MHQPQDQRVFRSVDERVEKRDSREETRAAEQPKLRRHPQFH